VTFDEIQSEIRLCYGAHQAFLRLGFEAEQIFCGVNGGRVLVVLRPPSKPEFVLTACESTPMTPEIFEAAWNRFVEVMQVDRSVTFETREQMFVEFRGLFPTVPLVAALVAKGLFPL
jgi:hypothetical protein